MRGVRGNFPVNQDQTGELAALSQFGRLQPLCGFIIQLVTEFGTKRGYKSGISFAIPNPLLWVGATK